MKQYKDMFIDFDDTLYDTRGNAIISLAETFDYFSLDRYFDDPEKFYDSYWRTNIDLWSIYNKDSLMKDKMSVEIISSDCITAAIDSSKKYPNYRIGVLNFCDALIPGGSVLKGAIAQEEDICRCTNLYPVLSSDKCFSFYLKIGNPRIMSMKMKSFLFYFLKFLRIIIMNY